MRVGDLGDGGPLGALSEFGKGARTITTKFNSAVVFTWRAQQAPPLRPKCKNDVSVRRAVNVVLLPMQGWIGLDDHAFLGPALEFFDQAGFARFQGFGDFGMDAQT